jgi:hypothetical protein
MRDRYGPLEVREHSLALALLCAIQAVELRASQAAATYDARAVLSPGTRPLYEAARGGPCPESGRRTCNTLSFRAHLE